MAKQYAGRQTRELVEAAGPETAGPEEVAAPVRRSSAPVLVGAADDRAEAEADTVAAGVLSRLADYGVEEHQHAPGCGHAAPVQRSTGGATGAIGAAGGALAEQAEADLASSRGSGSPLDAGLRRTMETGFGRALPGDVRIHTDARADRLAGGMNAVAFTHGSDIHFSAGAYAPGSSDGLHLLAHELTHVVQQREGTAVRRKMAGLAVAIRSEGQEKGDKGKTSGRLRRVTGKLTHWDALVEAVAAYEAEEAKVLKAAKKNPLAAASKRPKLRKLLGGLTSKVAKWRAANPEAVDADRKAALDDENEQREETHGSGETVARDVRTKADRRAAIAKLETRIGHELQQLDDTADFKTWVSSNAWGATNMVAAGAGGAGQVNEVTKMRLTDAQGQQSVGMFKPDPTMNAVYAKTSESDVGISMTDPNYAGRALAMYKLDKLFDAGVTARVETAVLHDGGKATMGTLMELASGKAASNMSYAVNARDAGRIGGDVVNMEDPVFQRGLNKLQLLDAISGQLDRHAGNYFIDANADGSVNRVTGIDLDMAFGEKMTTATNKAARKEKVVQPDGSVTEVARKRDAAIKAMNYRGLPDYFDEDFAKKIESVTAKDIEAALTGLLKKGEIDATIERLDHVKQHIALARKEGRLIAANKWGAETAQRGKIEGGGTTSDLTSYRDDLNIKRRGDAGERVLHVMGRMTQLTNFPKAYAPMLKSPEFAELVTKAKGYSWLKHLSEWAFDHDLTQHEIDQMTLEFFRHGLTPAVLKPTLEQLQAGTQPDLLANTFGAFLGTVVDDFLKWFEPWLDLDRLDRSL